jgi:hypothetical protein
VLLAAGAEARTDTDEHGLTRTGTDADADGAVLTASAGSVCWRSFGRSAG